MPRYRRIETISDVRQVAENPERWEIDFKSHVKLDDRWEMAKDMTGFANHLGGALLVGVRQRSEYAGADVHGIAVGDAPKLARAYENAARDHCSPALVVAARVFELEGDRCVVVVNVEPNPDQLVGARASIKNQNGDRVNSPDAWRFFVRIGTDNVSLTPEQLPMYMDPASRRTIIRLDQIPSGEPVDLVWRHLDDIEGDGPQRQQLEDWTAQPAENVLQCKIQRDDAENRDINIPLDDVEAIWKDRTTWLVRVRGYLKERPTLEYVSEPIAWPGSVRR